MTIGASPGAGARRRYATPQNGTRAESGTGIGAQSPRARHRIEAPVFAFAARYSATSIFAPAPGFRQAANMRSPLRLLAGAIPLLMAMPSLLAAAVERPKEIRVVTYNVLADPIQPEERAAAISRILAAADGDIIALQEVVPWFAERLLREQWVQPYHRAQRDGRTIIAHEFLILSRFPVVSFHTEPLVAGVQRRVLHAVTLETGGEPLVVATCHLESLLQDGPVRAEQLDQFAAHLASAPEAFFLGDFNFGDGEQPETARLLPEFRDAWLATRPNEPGYTWDRKRSAMARRESLPGERSRRIDRILIKSSRWDTVRVEIIGDQPLPGTKGRIFPSDHFGLTAVLRRRDAAESIAKMPK
jgi:endonuclease/exonuclease/phosphatase family metal-dependent hydrolase